MTQCSSTFLGVQCQEPDGHPGGHHYRDSSSHVTTWDDRAADQVGVGKPKKTNHAITLVWKRRNSDGRSWKVECLCGFKTVGYESRYTAEAMGDEHIASINRLDEAAAVLDFEAGA